MRLALVIALLGACTDERGLTGRAGWLWMGDVTWVRTSGVFTIAYARPIEGGWAIETLEYDGAIGCDEAMERADRRMVFSISTPALEAPVNTTMSVVDPFDSTTPTASLVIDGKHTTAGAFLLSDTGDPIKGRFDGATFQAATVSGNFTAVRCR